LADGHGAGRQAGFVRRLGETFGTDAFCPGRAKGVGANGSPLARPRTCGMHALLTSTGVIAISEIGDNRMLMAAEFLSRHRAVDISSKRHALLIVNAHSRQGRASAAAAAEILRSNGIRLLQRESDDRRQLAELIRAHATEVDRVILGGGDGTLNAAIGAVIETGLPLGILPLGTANDLARTLGLPLDLQEASRVIAAGRTRAIDVGRVNDGYFFNVASLGLSVDLTRELTPARKRRWGKLGYTLAMLRVLLRARPFSAVIRANGDVQRVKTLQIAIGNGHYYGAGMSVEQSAAIDDGRLDVYSLELRHPWKLALIYPAFRRGRHKRWPDVRTFACEELEIRTRKPRPINTDGELTTATPARFTVLRNAITVYVP
jgi:diacylglycerol kinase (ATP)